jgi:two-component system LytT family response regulator
VAQHPATVPDCLTIHQWNRVHLVRTVDIDWIEAEDNYVVVHAAGKRYKGRERIGDVESRLDPRRFVRIHRSAIVHVGRIREVQPLTHGDHAVVLHDGKVLRVARSRRRALGEALAIEL